MKHTDHIGLMVDSLEEAKRVLVDILGLRVAEETEVATYNLRVAFLTSADGSIRLEVVEKVDKTGLNGRTGVIEHVAFEVDDLNEHMDALRKKGVQFEEKVIRFREPYGETLAVGTLPDTTFGVRLQFVERLE